ncbi:AfsR/SARP family transcriptional regulator [Nonomuraea sp. SYSU D8015]|uniref:AfsR/SARP family transcriptional regulator n=1 Tax=Nonomuraea sp. SYSU D8015 TaxID=2593644 RepID=UPI001660A201|nr:BTAD domain-containing putative transcriptional regulator [Nonomuraea sp. SYSU D8015]
MASQEVRFAVFGGVRVWRAETELAVGPPQQRALLGLLLVAAGRPVGVAEIVDTLWGEDPSPSAVNLVHRYVGALRRVLEPDLTLRSSGRWLLRVGEAYRIAADATSLDLLTFRDLVAKARAEQSAQAVESWVRALEIADGVVAAGVPVLREHPAAVAVAREVVDAAVEAASVALRHGAGALAVPALQRIAATHPLDEPLQAAAMRLLAAVGRHVEALALYTGVRERLARQLGIHPSPVLQDAHHDVLRAETVTAVPETEPVPALPRPAQVPAATAVFAGRAAEVDTVAGHLESAEDHVAIMVIGGMGGSGKTTLAIQCAHQVADRFPDGQLYVNLRGFDPDGRIVAARDALGGFLEALGASPAHLPDGLEERAARFRSMLAGRRMLLVLDNARDTGQVEPLLPGTPGCGVIVTSRNRLTGLTARHGALPVRLGPMPGEQARQLLGRRLGRDRVEEDAEATGRIIEHCAGLPLALALVAARAAHNSFDLATLAEQLARTTSALDAFTVDEDTVDLRAVFSWSYHTLPEAAATLFRQLAAHPGPDISLPAAISLTGLPERAARQALAVLCAANLLEEPVPGRYALHDLLRAYAQELSSAAEQRTALERLVQHYTHSVRNAYLIYGRPPVGEPAPPGPGIIAERPADVTAANDWYQHERAVLHNVVKAADSARLDAAVVHLVLDWRPMSQAMDTLADADPYIRLCLEAAQRVGELPMLAEAHRAVGTSDSLRNDHDSAQRHLSRALELFQEIGDTVGEAHSLRNLSQSHNYQDDLETAIEIGRRAVEAARRSGDRPTLVVCLADLATLLDHLLLFEETLAVVAEAQQIAQEAQIAYAVPWLLACAGQAHLALGHAKPAADHLRQAVDLVTAQQNLAFKVPFLALYGDAVWDTGEHDTAREIWAQYWSLSETGEAEQGLAGTHFSDTMRERDAARHRLAALDPVPEPPPTMREVMLALSHARRRR